MKKRSKRLYWNGSEYGLVSPARVNSKLPKFFCAPLLHKRKTLLDLNRLISLTIIRDRLLKNRKSTPVEECLADRVLS